MKSSVKPCTGDVILPFWQPVRGSGTRVADAVAETCSETGGVAAGIRSDL